MSSTQLTCESCGQSFPNSRTSCPHCARPQLFPNVSNAGGPAEKRKLDERFSKAKARCDAEDRGAEFERFRTVAAGSHALFNCALERLHREIASGTDIIETYYQLEELRLRVTGHPDLDWDKLRPQAEIALLGSHHHIERLHYACLSLTWDGLTSYGDCVVKLDDKMIGHRASCFEGNTAVVFFIRGNFRHHLRSVWSDRGRIAAAIFADRLQKGVSDAEFPKILVAQAGPAVDDEFIEVHLFGTMTVKTFAAVKFPANIPGKRELIMRDAIIEKLNQASIAHFA